MLGVLCGLEAEAKIARRIDGAIVACAAARPFKARELALELVEKGATRLLSFGIAGSLQASFGLGDLVIGSRVTSAQGQWACDKIWGDDLMRRLPQAKRGGVYGSETLVPTAHDKMTLCRLSGSDIVDMESQCAAEVAASHHLPLMVIRAVCDDSHMNVPPSVTAAIKEDGNINVRQALFHIARNPFEIIDLLHMLSGTHKALNALKKAIGKLAV